MLGDTASQQEEKAPPISALLCHEYKDKSEVYQFMTIRGALTEKTLSSQPKGQISYRRLPSKRYAVAYWGTQFSKTLNQKTLFFNSILKLVQKGKAVQLQELESAEQEAMKDFIRLLTASEPEAGTMIAAGTTTSEVYNYEGRIIVSDKSSSSPKLEPKLFKGLPSNRLPDERLREISQRMRDIFSLEESSEITYVPWSDNFEGGSETDAGETLKFYIEQRRVMWTPLKDVIQRIVAASKERNLRPSDNRTKEQQAVYDAFRQSQKAKGNEKLTPEEIRTRAKLLGVVHNIDLSVMVNIEGKPLQTGQSFQLTNIWK
jgi:hypothetical protein